MRPFAANASNEVGIECSQSDLIDNLALCEARSIDHRRLIGNERYSDCLAGHRRARHAKSSGLTIRSVSALFALPPGFRILYITHKVRSPRLPQGLLPARVETVVSEFLSHDPLGLHQRRKR